MKELLILLGGAAALLTLLCGSDSTIASNAQDPDADDLAELPPAVPARVTDVCRTMDPVSLKAGSRVSFALEDGRCCTLFISGEGGLHLRPGDEGLLTANGETFISFEKPDGEIIGAMYCIPAKTEEEET